MTNHELDKSISVVGAYYCTVAESELYDSDRIVWHNPILRISGAEDPLRRPKNAMQAAKDIIDDSPFDARFLEFPFKEEVRINKDALCPTICIVGGKFMEGPKRESILQEIGSAAIAEVEPIAVKYEKYPTLPLEEDAEVAITSKVFVVDKSDCYPLRSSIKEELLNDLFLDLLKGSPFDPWEEANPLGNLSDSGTISSDEFLGLYHLIARRENDLKEIARLEARDAKRSPSGRIAHYSKVFKTKFEEFKQELLI